MISKAKQLKKFINCDIYAVLGEIVERHVQHYKSDFSYDKTCFQNAAFFQTSSETNFLWLCRPCGTELSAERDVYVLDTRAHNTWVYFGEQTNDPIIAFAVEVKGFEKGCVVGDLYELDYQEHYQRVKERSLPPHKVQLVFRHTQKLIDYNPNWLSDIQNREILRAITLPADLAEWDRVIQAAQAERHNDNYEEWDFGRLLKFFSQKESDVVAE